MSLPHIESILYDFEIPSTKQTVKVKQLRARDEKILLTAKESSGSPEERNVEILNSIKQVIQNCIVTPGIDTEKLALFDIEMAFIKLRALSVSNIVTASYQDNEEMQDYHMAHEAWKAKPLAERFGVPPPEPVPYKFDIDLNKVSVKWPEQVSKEIKVPGNVIIRMKYPDASLYTNKQFLAASGSQLIDYLIQNSLEAIVEASTVTYPKDLPVSEVKEFLDDLPIMVYDKIQEFLSNLPTVFYEIKYTNNKGNKRTIILDKLSDFFSF